MRWTSDASANAVYVLIALRTMFSKVDAGTEHAADVRMPLVEPFLHDGIDEWAAVEQHPFTRLMTVLFGDFLTAMRISFPQFAVLDFLNLVAGKRRKNDEIVESSMRWEEGLTRIMLYRLKKPPD